MKASEYILELQKLIDEHGDLEVYFDDGWILELAEPPHFSLEDGPINRFSESRELPQRIIIL